MFDVLTVTLHCFRSPSCLQNVIQLSWFWILCSFK